ncbi:hypothetical protein [Nonomuraea longicatena]|uniref:Uncharacterized protein n=1 Tax=Nonomuraea longicatena TaxID=83682 RepID=A0ABP4AKA9_9ACTN
MAVATGAAAAQRPAQRGTKVAVVILREDKLNALIGSIQAVDGTAMALPVDVTDHDAVGLRRRKNRRRRPSLF